jgi:general secretion pathway protein N
MKRLLLGGLLFVVLVATYLVMLPATWMDALLQRASQGAFAMTAAKGTLWRGEGSLQALLPSGEAVTLMPLRWHIVGGELLSLKLHLQAQSARDNKPVLDVVLSQGEANIRQAKLDLPAALLGVLSPTLREASLSGQLALQVDELRIDRGRAAGKAQAYWKGAGSSLSRIRPLGNYLLVMNGKGEAMDFNLTTMGGPLTLNGSGSWIPGKAPDLRIMATPEESARQDLAPLLRMFGRETSPGTYQLIIDPSVRAISS